MLAVLPRAGIIHSREIIFYRDTLEIQISRALAVHFALPRCRSPVDQTIAQKIAPEYENTNERRKNGVGGDVTSFLREQKGERERERETCDPLTARYDARNWTPIPIWLPGETGARFNTIQSGRWLP